MGEIFTLALLFSSLRLATPLIFAALGGLFSERSGVINIALEGLMLAGAFTAAVVTYQVGDPYIGVVAGVAAGAFLAFIYAVACIKFEADQVVAGMAINFLMIGLPALISGAIYDSSGSTPQIDKVLQLPDFYNRISIATIVALALVPICWWIMYKTPFGLRIRATGENPDAAETAGVNVIRLRYIAVTISGVLAGLGGAYLSIGQSSLFTRNMTAGRGFIALAALILAKWRPVPVLGACLFFGLTEALSIQIQGASWARIGGEEIPVQFIQIIPYLLTIIVLAGFIGLSRAPKALGIPYSKED
ncbi:MAG: ABC transporter permease [Pyrinomonadaceae bacterium]|nr:ABC transporter permease [Pyrinomonadaceae bacterium]